MEPPMNTSFPYVLGIDPGTNTGWCLTDPQQRAIACGTLKLSKLKGIERLDSIRLFVLSLVYGTGVFSDLRSEHINMSPATYIVLEDVSTMATAGTQGRHAVGVLQRDFAAMAMALYNHFGKNLILAPPTKWYPRIGGQMANKALAIKLLRASAAPFELPNEHTVMAFGLALYGHRKVRTPLTQA
jgi:hypothetical protein